jgi:hypothetical protein
MDQVVGMALTEFEKLMAEERSRGTKVESRELGRGAELTAE